MLMHSHSRVSIKTPAEQEAMRLAGRLAADVLDMIGPRIAAGMTTAELDRICHDYIVDVQKAIPAPLNYKGFPKSVCTSVNHVVCHGIPGDKVLKGGDILNVDITAIKKACHADTSRMFLIGDPSIQARRLCEIGYEAMWRGIRMVRPGTRLGDLGHVIQSFVEAQGYSVVREYCGHGIGRVFHEEPQVLHYGEPGTGLLLKEGMTFTVEPMINLGGADVEQLEDGWTVVTADNSLSAQWEHMVAVTKNGVEILTPWPKG